MRSQINIATKVFPVDYLVASKLSKHYITLHCIALHVRSTRLVLPDIPLTVLLVGFQQRVVEKSV